jgi:hypothetical protein
MANIELETVGQIVAILGGAVALLLALLQIVDTYVDIGDKLHKRRLDRKNQAPKACDNNSKTISSDELRQSS